MRVLTHFLLWNLGLAKGSTWSPAAEIECLERHAAENHRLVEIGCWQGVNTRPVMAPDGVLFAVDPYSRGRLGFSAPQIIAHREVDTVQNGRVRWIRLTDVEAARWFVDAGEPPVDFVFSDCVNSFDGFRQTWEAWSPLVAPGGTYVLANSCSSTTRNLDDVGSAVYTRDVVLRDRRFRLLETADTVMQKHDSEVL